MGVELIENKRLAKALEEAQTDEAVQLLLDQVRPSFYQFHIRGENSLLVKPNSVAEPLGFHYTPRHTHLFIEALRGSLPMGLLERSPRLSRHYPQRYAFFLRRHWERAQEILENSPELGKFKNRTSIEASLWIRRRATSNKRCGEW